MNKPMVPLLVEDGYKPDGWLGFLLGTAQYFTISGNVLSSQALFDSEMRDIEFKLNTVTSHQTLAADFADDDDGAYLNVRCFEEADAPENYAEIAVTDGGGIAASEC